MEIKNKVIIITGASQGIGNAAAKLLAKEDAKLVLAARSKDTIEALAKELPDAIAIETDMRKPEDIERLIKGAIEKYGRIDVLVNNAGQGMYIPVEKIDLDKYSSLIELNVFGPLRAMQAVIPVLRSQGGGMILNVSSMVTKAYYPNLGAYASTKYALNALSLTARTELEPDNIIVSVLHPKMTATNFGENAITAEPGGIRTTARPAGMTIDTPELVAERLRDLIISEEAEAML